jgi:DedD protein
MVDMMEKKKLLLVSISVGVFLVIVIGASILVFPPRNPSPAAVMNTVPAVKPIPAGDPAGSVSAVELVKNSLTPEGGPLDNIVYIYGENPDGAVTVDPSGGNNRLVVDVRRPAAAAVPEAPPPKPAAAPVRQSPAPAPQAAAPKTDAPKVAAPQAAAPKTAAPKASAPKTPSASAAGSPPDNFWVQTGSFSTVARAEAAKDTLASRGIISLIENRNIEGKDFFRVRVGPYTSQKEADYWQKLIKEFKGFEGSMVLRSPAK